MAIFPQGQPGTISKKIPVDLVQATQGQPSGPISYHGLALDTHYDGFNGVPYGQQGFFTYNVLTDAHDMTNWNTGAWVVAAKFVWHKIRWRLQCSDSKTGSFVDVLGSQMVESPSYSQTPNRGNTIVHRYVKYLFSLDALMSTPGGGPWVRIFGSSWDPVSETSGLDIFMWGCGSIGFFDPIPTPPIGTGKAKNWSMVSPPI